nr:putative ribonuclease H-like domain-containing protein [Tanacetum cinerariifolium]
MCDKKNKILFTNINCLVLSSDFKLLDENQVLLKIPRRHNMYSFNLKNIDPSGDLAFLFSKASIDESNKWHRRLGHVNFKNLNKLVKGNLVRGLPSKIFENNHTCVACQKGKQHKASCKAKTVSSVNQSLQILHMDLFGPTSVRSIKHKTYCLVITDGFSRLKGIKREYSNARTLQQNGVVERKNMTLIEAARTMIEDIRIFLAFASYMGFIVYQMDVKSAFRYGTNDEEVYVSQPPGFVDPKFRNKVYKVMKALYGLHQAPRACSTKKSWCNEFEELMKNRFQMSSMGKLTFFLGLQTASTPIETQKPLVKDEKAADVDVHLYRSMIGSLMYLTASRPDIMFAVYACSRFSVTPKSSQIQSVKRIFRDAYEKKLIQVLKIHTDDNVDDLLTKAFGVSRLKILVVNIGMINM